MAMLTRSNTAIVLCTPTTRSYLINYARTLIYTTAPSHPSLALIKATYDALLAGKTQPVSPPSPPRPPKN